MFKKILIALSLIIMITGCETIPEKDNKNNTEIKEKDIVREDPSKMKVTAYGADKEVQAVEINDKVYYIIGGKDPENMTEQEVKKLSLAAPLKIAEETVKGIKGIVVSYYDVKVFLGRRTGINTSVGIFEPQKNDWTIGSDLNRSLLIQIKLPRSTSSIDIKRGSISLGFN
ncbi:hypothetical protein [uncultured Brachyspira sp.]|uniref:hypothetical protein n=1 Tax=uncultured Brachyspira sp. TaxID=221953 RepID=UPI0025CFC858|nr:hypothetical protein [uncultured Brachyspira sp.]